jgi:archaellum component FlaC
MRKEEFRLKEIDQELSKLKHSLEGLIPIWSQIDRRLHALKEKVRLLEEERFRINEGQLQFDEFDF